MSNTHRHLIAGIFWFLGLPLAGIALIETGLIAVEMSVASSFATWLWGAGLLGVFASWSWRDVHKHGKPRYLAVGCSAAWILLPFLVVFPYLFITRGVKQGLVTSLQYLCFLLAGLVLFMSLVPLLGRTFF